jgi:hypothetical protein
MRLTRLALTLCTVYLTSALTNWEQIHQTLARYPLAIDSKNFTALSLVFAPDAVANYTGQASNLTGLAGIQEGLAQAVSTYSQPQHLLGTIVIDMHEPAIAVRDGKADGGLRKKATANSTQYFQATLFSSGSSDVTTLFGYYADCLAKRPEGWRIEKRQLTFQVSLFSCSTSDRGIRKSLVSVYGSQDSRQQLPSSPQNHI